MILSKILLKHGVKLNDKYQTLPDITIYPSDYFSPKIYSTGQTRTSENTHSIHHQVISWASEKSRQSRKEKWDFYEKYAGDEFLVKLYQNDINKMSLRQLYKIVIKRTIKKIIGKHLYEKLKSPNYSNLEKFHEPQETK